MSHGDWQSWDVFVVIMVIIMSHNRIKLFHCFADVVHGKNSSPTRMRYEHIYCTEALN